MPAAPLDGKELAQLLAFVTALSGPPPAAPHPILPGNP
jgi:hypothetical protein